MTDDPNRETRIRDRAYDLWDREGRPEYRHLDHWDQARREIEAEEDARQTSATAPGPSAGVQNPTSVIERNLREAALRMKAAGGPGADHSGKAHDDEPPGADADPHEGAESPWPPG